MLSAFNVPRVENESDSSKNTKMTTVICIVFITILLLIYLQKPKSVPHVHHTTNQLETVAIDIHNNTTNTPVAGKYVVLTNINRKNIPVKKIVAIGANRQLYPVDIKDASKFNKAGGNGIVIEFELPKEILITQIIVDVDVLCGSHPNIRTTQVELRDADHKMVWSYGELMPVGDRYVTVYVVKPKIVYDNKPQQVLCNASAGNGRYGHGTPAYRSQDCNQELILTDNIATNSWL